MSGTPKKRARREALETLGIDGLCDAIADGSSLRQVAESLGMREVQVRNWIDASDERVTQYARAREVRTHMYAEQIVEISDSATPEDVGVAKLRVDSRKWVASKLLPKTYGDRVQVDSTVRIAPREMTDDELARIVAGGISGAATAAQGAQEPR